MSDIIKTWPAVVSSRTSLSMFDEDTPPFTMYFFTLGRGRPKLLKPNVDNSLDTPTGDRLWFTYKGHIMGCFPIVYVMQNDGTLPRLNRLDGGESAWQFKRDAWIAICKPPCIRLKERIFMSGFRGFRYFNIEEYRRTPESRINL
jgi:hypothetical protein